MLFGVSDPPTTGCSGSFVRLSLQADGAKGGPRHTPMSHVALGRAEEVTSVVAKRCFPHAARLRMTQQTPPTTLRDLVTAFECVHNHGDRLFDDYQDCWEPALTEDKQRQASESTHWAGYGLGRRLGGTGARWPVPRRKSVRMRPRRGKCRKSATNRWTHGKICPEEVVCGRLETSAQLRPVAIPSTLT